MSAAHPYVTTKLDQADERLAAGNSKGALKSLEDAFYNLPNAPSEAEYDRLIELLSRLAERDDGRFSEKARKLIPQAEQGNVLAASTG